MDPTVPSAARRIARAQARLVVLDIQERLLPSIHDRQRVLDNAVRLLRGAAVLAVPVLVTEQYRRGLGPTVPEVAAAAAPFLPIEKITFSACGEPAFRRALPSDSRADVVLCGIEAHVCVTQTCLDLLDLGHRVFVVADAVSSRTPDNHRAGVDRMRAAGAVVVSTEMILFELLDRAGTGEFKQVLPLVR